ncbi:translocation/assembly module TamB domain-containing protein [Bartonella sp. LJL80]
MMRISHISAIVFGLFMLLCSSFVHAQNTPAAQETQADEDKSWVLSFIERTISAPNRQIKISNIQGALSSSATIGSITVGDRNGVWLKITNAKMDWSRLALLRGQISIDQLSAERIDVLRKPLPSTSAPSPESRSFAIPELPVAVNVKSIDAKTVAFGPELFGLQSQVSLKGALSLADGDLETKLVMQRLDAAGSFDIFTDISNKKRKAKIDIKISEPENGIIANVLKIENRPPVALTVKGDGSLDNLVVTLAMQAGVQPVLNGTLKLLGTEQGQTISADLSGPISMLMPGEYQPFFGSDTSLKLNALSKKDGGLRLETLAINGAAIHVSASGETLADGFLRRLQVNAEIASANGGTLILPVAGGKTSANKIALNVDYGTNNAPMWSGQFVVNNFANENFHAHDITFDMGGDSENLDDAATRHVGVQVTGGINGITTSSSKVSAALGSTINLKIDTDIMAGQPVTVRTVNLTANGLTVWLKGQIEKLVFKGDLGVKADTLAPLAMLSGKPLSGAVDIEGKGTIGLLTGAFDLDLAGTTNAVKTGIDAADRLLAGNVKLSGGIVRDQAGFTTRNFQLGNDKLKLTANGQFSSVSADMDFGVELADLGLLDPRMKGPITLKGAARGHNRLVALSVGAKIHDATLSGRKMQNTALYLNALLDNTSPIRSYISGALDGDGIFAGETLQLAGSFADNDNGRGLNGLNIRVGGAQISGDLTQNLAGLVTGKLHIDAPDISTLAALALTEGRGSMKGDFAFTDQDGKQSADLSANIRKLVFANNHIESLDMKAGLSDPTGQLRIDGYINAQNIQTPAVAINTLAARANGSNGQTAFSATADMQNNTKAELAGALIYADAAGGERMTINLDRFMLSQDMVHAKLVKPASIALSDAGYQINNFMLDVNGGSLSLAGNVGKTLDLRVIMDALPVSLANIVRSHLGASGTLTGQADIKGTTENPNIQFALKGQELTLAALKEKNIAPLTLNAHGTTDGKSLAIKADVSGGGLDVNATGKVPLGQGNLDVDVVLKNLPVALANGFVSGQNLGGAITGNAHIGGAVKNPTARFNLAGQGLTAQIIANNGLAPISLTAQGAYENSVLNLERLNANGPQGLNISAQGRIPVLGNGIDLSVKGSAPLGIANQFLAERGAQVSGSATVDATVKGSFAQPQLGGSFAVSNGSFLDSETNLRLNGITVQGSLNGDRIVLNSVNATSSAGGSIAASGSISTDFAAGMPADITVRLNHTRYSDGAMVVATVDGTVTVTGALLRDPVIGGDITIEKAEITVPDRFGGAAQIDVKHKHLTKAIETTLERAKIITRSSGVPVPANRPSVPQLKMRIRAPNQIFVRGMGLDVELGGGIGLVGPINDIHPVGGFQMLRGRFDILSQRLEFSEGRVTLVGNLNPEVNFVATSDGSDITVTVTVSGTIDALDIKFTSTPELPQDEVLARLIFNRSISELSPFQIAQLASAAAELAGVTNTSLLGALRSSTGLDDLDVVTDAQGNTGVRAGRYIRDNIYLGVEAGSGGNTKGTVNLDISKNLKAKGALGAEGDSSVGVFYEKDY